MGIKFRVLLMSRSLISRFFYIRENIGMIDCHVNSSLS